MEFQDQQKRKRVLEYVIPGTEVPGTLNKYAAFVVLCSLHVQVQCTRSTRYSVSVD